MPLTALNNVNLKMRDELDRLPERIMEPDFLENGGIYQEFRMYIFCYDVKDQKAIDYFMKEKIRNGHFPFQVIEVDLFQFLIEILDEKNLCSKSIQMEEKKGIEKVLKSIGKYADDGKQFVNHLDGIEYEPGRTVVFITGIEKVYPFIRSNKVWNAVQEHFKDVPVIVFYPGIYRDSSLILFDDERITGIDTGCYQAYVLYEGE